MKNVIRSSMAAAGVAATLMVAPAAFANDTDALMGTPGSIQSVDHVVRIAPNAKWVNATAGETIQFVDEASGKSFVWQFDAASHTMFDLAAVAPEVLGGHHVTAYVADNPLYSSVGD